MQRSRLSTTSSKFPSSSLKAILGNQLEPSQWPQLEQIMYCIGFPIYSKFMEESIVKSAKNREYLVSQQCQDKIKEAREEIKKRNLHEIQQKLKVNLEELESRIANQDLRFEKEWGRKAKKGEEEQIDLIYKKIEKQNEERDRYLQQIEMALPNTHSPDQEIHRLRYEEQHFAKEGKFVEAQKMKERIDLREDELNGKHRKVRENNIGLMMKDLESKHRNEIGIMEKRRDEKLQEVEREKQKKKGELDEKHERERRELKWIFTQEMKRQK